MRINKQLAYANKHKQLASESLDKHLDFFCTPLALIPVDFLPFYLSPGEYESLPNGCKVKNVCSANSRIRVIV